MPTKIITAIAFRTTIEVDDAGKIIQANKHFQQFINQPLTQLELALKRQRFHNIIIENLEEEKCTSGS